MLILLIVLKVSLQEQKKDYNIAYDYYLNEKWKEFYMGRVDTLEYINQHLDRKLMLEMGYKIFKK